MISASKNRPLFFSKSKLVQNIGRCGSSRLPAAQLRKPHDKANLKRKKMCLSLESEPRKKELGFLEFFSLYGEFVVGEHPSRLDFFPEKPPKRQVWAVSSRHPPLLMPHSSFLSSPCQWPLWTIRGRLSQRLTPQHLNLWPGSSNSQGSQPRNEILLKLEHGFCYLFIADCDWGLHLRLFMIQHCHSTK